MTDYDILVEELNNILEKWNNRLSYNTGHEKNVHDIYLCSTVIYEIERAKQRAANRIAQERVNKTMEKELTMIEDYKKEKFNKE